MSYYFVTMFVQSVLCIGQNNIFGFIYKTCLNVDEVGLVTKKKTEHMFDFYANLCYNRRSKILDHVIISR